MSLPGPARIATETCSKRHLSSAFSLLNGFGALNIPSPHLNVRELQRMDYVRTFKYRTVMQPILPTKENRDYRMANGSQLCAIG